MLVPGEALEHGGDAVQGEGGVQGKEGGQGGVSFGQRIYIIKKTKSMRRIKVTC